MATFALSRCDFFDIFPPEIEIVTPKEGTSYFGTLPIELKATDNRRVDKVEVFVNGTSVHEFTDAPYKADLDISGQSAGTKTFKAIAYDQAGNHAEDERQVNISLGFKLTSPNGGELWAEQSTQTITWTTSGEVGDSVSLHYSLDSGTNWTQITPSTANDGAHPWTLPDLTEIQTTCRVKVASTSTSYADTSDADFSITTEANYITVISPNGGEEWPEQSTQTIIWTSSGDVGDNVSLNYSLDEGANWTQIIASTPNDGSHPWTLPDLTEIQTTYRVKVASTSTSYADTSDADFSITTEANYITVTSPNGGEGWPEQSTQTITWTSSGDVGNSVSLHYSLDGGTNWTEIIASTPNDGSHSWTLPDLTEIQTACRVKVASSSYSDISNANFTITTEANYITVTSPNGGEEWPEQSTQTITWTTSGDVGAYVSLHYSLDGGASWTLITASTPNTGSYSWTLPNLTETVTTCQVKVADASYSDVSDADFTITWSPIALVGSYNTPGLAMDVFISGSYAYVADGSRLRVIDVSNPANPALASSYDTPGYAVGVFVSGGYAYVADNDSGLQIIDVSNPASPTLVGSYSTPDMAHKVFVSGSYAYVSDGLISLSPPPATMFSIGGVVSDILGATIGLLVIDLDDYLPHPDGSAHVTELRFASFSSATEILRVDYTNPQPDGNPTTDTLQYSDLRAGDQLTVTSGQNIRDLQKFNVSKIDVIISGLQIINVVDQVSPTMVGSYDATPYPEGVFVSGSYAYLAEGSSGINIINVSSVANPTLASSYDTQGLAYDVFVSGSDAYVAAGSFGVHVINVSNPASPILISSYDTPGSAYDVFVSTGYAYVADISAGIQVVDVSNPASPVLAASYDTPGATYAVFVSGNYAYVADGPDGLLIFDVSGLP